MNGTSVPGFRVAESSEILFANANYDSMPVWNATMTDRADCKQEYWAPELHYFSAAEVGAANAGWYIYFTADDGDNENHRMFVLRADDPENPTGSYSLAGKLATAGNLWAIDGTVLRYSGKLYLVWSGKPQAGSRTQNLYIQPMQNPYTMANSAAVCISTPTLGYELLNGHINEGPQALKLGNTTHIIYSANGSSTEYYRLAMLTLTGSDPMRADAWTKASSPLFVSDASASMWGPGHASFVQNRRDNTWWVYYHANEVWVEDDWSSGTSTWWGQRRTYIQQFRTAAATIAGKSCTVPSFGKPLAATALRPLVISSPDFCANGHFATGNASNCPVCGMCRHPQGALEYKTITPSTCTTKGTETIFCKNCNKQLGTRQAALDPHAHTGYKFTAAGSTFNYVCTGCNAAVKTGIAVPTLYVDNVDTAGGGKSAAVGKDTNRGDSADAPLKSLTAAIGRMNKTGGKIVLLDRYQITDNVSLPSYEKEITFTTDSALSGFTTGFVNLKHGAVLSLGGPTKFETILFNHSASTQNDSDQGYYKTLVIVGNWNNVTFGTGLQTWGNCYYVAGTQYPQADDATAKHVTLRFARTYACDISDKQPAVTFFDRIYLGVRGNKGITVSNKTVTATFDGTTVLNLYGGSTSTEAQDLQMKNCQTVLNINKNAYIKNLYSAAGNTCNTGTAYLDKFTVNLNENARLWGEFTVRNVRDLTVNVSGADGGREKDLRQAKTLWLSLTEGYLKSANYTGKEKATANYTAHSFMPEVRPEVVRYPAANVRVNVLPDTCTWTYKHENGACSRTCSVCGKTETVQGALEYQTVTPSTCTTKGTETIFCKNCNKQLGTRQAALDPHAHTGYKFTAAGSTFNYVCTGCNAAVKTGIAVPTLYVDNVDTAGGGKSAAVGKDTNRGDSADAPLKSLTAAIGRMNKTGGKIVLLDRYQITDNVSLPSYEKEITFTTDSALSGFTTGFVNLKHGAVLSLGGPTKFETILFNHSASTQNDSDQGYYKTLVIVGNWNNVTFGTGLQTWGNCYYVAGTQYPQADDATAKHVTLRFARTYACDISDKQPAVTFFDRIYLGVRGNKGITVSNKTVTATFDGTTVLNLYGGSTSTEAQDLQMKNCQTVLNINKNAYIKNLYSAAGNTCNTGTAYLDKFTVNLNENARLWGEFTVRNVRDLTVNVSGADGGREKDLRQAKTLWLSLTEGYLKSANYTGKEKATANYTAHSFMPEVRPEVVRYPAANVRVNVLPDTCTWTYKHENGACSRTCSVCGKTETVLSLAFGSTSTTRAGDTVRFIAEMARGESAAVEKYGMLITALADQTAGSGSFADEKFAFAEGTDVTAAADGKLRFAADLTGIPAGKGDTPIYAWAYVKLAGADDLVILPFDAVTPNELKHTK